MCEPATIAMLVIAVAMSVKASMDAKRNAAIQRKNAIAQQKIEQEALLKKRAEEGDASAMAAFEKARATRVDNARIRVAKGENGGMGNFQMNMMLQGLGFGQGLQTASDERSANAKIAGTDLQLRASSQGFTNRMRTINASDPSGLSVGLAAAGAGANAFAGSPGAFSGGAGTAPKTTGNLNIQTVKGV